MKGIIRAILLCGTISLFSSRVVETSFPENGIPRSVTSVNDVQYSVFTGDDASQDVLRHTQDMKMVKVAGKDYYAITGREKLFLVHPDDFSPAANAKIPFTEVFTWITDEEAKNICVMKGQGEENCQNYIRVMEQKDEEGNSFLVCATNSFEPLCVELTAFAEGNKIILSEEGDRFSGTEKCAFGPDQTGVSLYTGNSLYSATVSEFSGRSYTITRSLGDVKKLRTPKFDSKFLNEPYFVKMIEDGDKVLIFMNEMVKSQSGDVRMVAYVAQVCKNDVGGQHVLVRQWTKFEKSRLNCSLNGFYFDQLQDVSDPVEVQISAGSENRVRTIYATFTTPENSVPGTAVCAFTIDSIHDALLGRFREERTGGTSHAPTGSRHPGHCPIEQYTDSELVFLKSHPLLEDQARGSLLTTNVGERWTSVAVDTQAGPQKNWTVYFVGTTKGQVLRYLAPTSGLKNSVLLRRQDVYDARRCGTNVTDEEDKSVSRIVVDSKRDQILITFKHCVTSIPLRSCAVHKCKKSCIASADPYCGWNGSLCVSFVTPSVNVEQHIFSEARNAKSNIENLCPEEDTIPISNNKGGKLPHSSIPNKDNVDSQTGREQSGPDYNITNGSFVDETNEETHAVSQEQGAIKSSGASLEWYFVVVVAACTLILSLVLFFTVSRTCKSCKSKKMDEEKQGGIEMSRSSINNSEGLCKRIISSLSPKRGRKPSIKPPSLSQSRSTLVDQQGVPLMPKKDSKSDELVKPNDHTTVDHTRAQKSSRPGSRLNSVSGSSQVTMTESLPSYSSSRRQSHQPFPSSSMTSMTNKGRPAYNTAPRNRNYSGNRTSDPSDYSNAPTLRADRTNPRMSSRPISVPMTPNSNKEFFPSSGALPGDVVEDTEHVLHYVKEVIEQQEQRQSAEMETVLEETEDGRLRHNSSDSGKGPSPRNSVQNEDQDKLSTLSRHYRPESITIMQPPRGRKRLNSEPTSPTVSGPPLPPPSSHKPVSRSASVRSQHAISVPHYMPRNRSDSVSFQSPAPMGHGSPRRIQQMVQNGFTPQAKPNVYATLPHNPQSSSNGHAPMENFSRQQSYDHYAHHDRFDWNDQRDHPAAQVPDRYSSLPLRSQAHRSNKNFAGQYVPHPAQMNGRKNSATPQIPPPKFQKQMSSPAGLDPKRNGHRGVYVAPPVIPTYATLPEQDAV